MSKVKFISRADVKVGLPLLKIESDAKSKGYTIVNDTITVYTDPADPKSISDAINKVISEHKISAFIIDCTLSTKLLCDMLFELEKSIWDTVKYKSNETFMVTDVYVISDAEERYRRYAALISGMNLCKELSIAPANIMDPERFANECLKLAEYGVKVEILDRKAIAKLGMEALLAVSQGSAKEPRVVTMQYMGDPDSQDITAFVGKGVCFDSGGLFIKDATMMPKMKYDKSGAAAVVGGILSISKQKLKRNVIGVIGLVENMPDGNAIRPSDIITSMSGKTIEVSNTDAEGRLVLADCVYYAQQKFNPSKIITLATLTAETLGSLADQYAGLFSQDDKLADSLLTVGAASGDEVWRLPMESSFKKQLESDIADIKNWGLDNFGDNAAAAMFIAEFIDASKARFAHLDIAGMAWTFGVDKVMPRGYGVRLIESLI